MNIKFIKAGMQTSIQDLGRFGQMQNGVSHSGAMDPVAMQLANWLVAKPADSPVLEISLIGPEIEFDCALRIAVCGAQFDIALNNKPIRNDQTIQVNAGDRLSFAKLVHGARAYLAFSAELKLPHTLNSFSTHLTANFGGYDGRQFKAQDQLELNSIYHPELRVLPKTHQLGFSNHYLLRCVKSVETEHFDNAQQHQFFTQTFQVMAQSNRMGIRLKAEPLVVDQSLQLVSSGLTPGSIQIPPSGQPIIAAVDCQTIGGYPRVANVISADLAMLGQLKANDKINFALIEIDQAIAILQQKQSKLADLSKLE